MDKQTDRDRWILYRYFIFEIEIQDSWLDCSSIDTRTYKFTILDSGI